MLFPIEVLGLFCIYTCQRKARYPIYLGGHAINSKTSASNGIDTNDRVVMVVCKLFERSNTSDRSAFQLALVP